MTAYVVPEEPIARAALTAFARERGLRLTGESARGNGWVTARVFKGEDGTRLEYREEHELGTAEIMVEGPGEERLAAEARAAFPASTLEEAVARARAAGSPADRVRTLGPVVQHAMHAVDAVEAVAALIRERLADEHAPVRRAALVACFYLPWPEIDAAAEALAGDPELAGGVAALRETRALSASGEAGDYDTNDQEVLLARAYAAVREGNLERAFKAVAAILDETEVAQDAYAARALAHRAAGRPWMAWADLLTACALGHRHGADVSAWRALADEVRPLALAAGEAGEDVLENLERLLSVGRNEDVVEIADGLLAARSGREALLHFYRGMAFWDEDDKASAIPCFEAAVRLQPGSAEAWFFLGRCRHDARLLEAALEALARADDLLDQEESPFDARVGQLVRRRAVARWSRAELRAARVDILQQLGRDEEALAICEAQARNDPRDTGSLRARGILLTRLKRHEEAIEAYTAYLDAYDPGDRIVFGPDPRAVCHFNRACERALLGGREEALADLAEAIRMDSRYASRARTDESLASLWQDPRFLGLVERGEAVRVEERRGWFEGHRRRLASCLDQLSWDGAPAPVTAGIREILAEAIAALERLPAAIPRAEGRAIVERAMGRLSALLSAKPRPLDYFQASEVRDLVRPLARLCDADELLDAIDEAPWEIEG